jgi:hypothetical protein
MFSSDGVAYSEIWVGLVVGEYGVCSGGIMLGNRRWLSVTSTLLPVQYLKWGCCNLVTYNYISLLIEDIICNIH